jgi:DNA-directed RNA polymerase subunit L
MSSAKKRRDLNRAIEEHKTARLSAQFATSNHTMLNIVESILAKDNESLRAQIAKLTKTNLAQAAQIEMMRNELLLMKRDKWHWQEARDRALSTTPSQALADFAAKVRKQCAVICDGLQHQRNKYIEEDGAEGKPFVPRDCAEAIRNLKELP